MNAVERGKSRAWEPTMTKIVAPCKIRCLICGTTYLIRKEIGHSEMIQIIHAKCSCGSTGFVEVDAETWNTVGADHVEGGS